MPLRQFLLDPTKFFLRPTLCAFVPLCLRAFPLLLPEHRDDILDRDDEQAIVALEVDRDD